MDASDSASAGRMRAVRRAEMRAATQAPSRAAPTAAANGTKLKVSSRVSGMALKSMNLLCSQYAMGRPATEPRPPARPPMIRASRPIS